jgi:threonine/homoserine/homoserine lactone efflux protein
MPGPLLTITIGESVRRGASAGPLIIIGHALLEGGLVLLLLAGLSSFLVMREFVLASFLLGGAILLVMGGAMVRDSRTVDIDSVLQGERALFP